MEADDQKNPASPPSALESAIEAIERSLCPDGTGHGNIPDGERGGYKWRALFNWAGREGRSLSRHR